MIRQRQFGQRKSFDTTELFVVVITKFYVSFPSKLKATIGFPKLILKLKASDQSKQARKKLFCHVIIYDYLCDVLCKLLIKAKSKWRSEIRKQTSLLTLLYCGWTVAGKFAVSEIYIELGNCYCFKLASLVRNRV